MNLNFLLIICFECLVNYIFEYAYKAIIKYKTKNSTKRKYQKQFDIYKIKYSNI